MALTAVTIPTNINLSRNRIRLQMLSNAYLIAAGQPHQILFSVAGNPANGDTLNLQWTYQGEDYDITLTWATTPDGSENQVALLASGTMLNYLNTIFKNAIDLHPVLSDFFTVINISSGGFWLSAKNFGYQDLGVSVSGSFLLDGTIGPITFPSITAENPLVLREDLFFLVRFSVEDEWDSGIYNVITEAPYKPSANEDLDAIIDVDIQHFFEPSVRYYNMDTQEDFTSALQIIRSMNKRCRIEVFEYYNNAKRGKAYRSPSFRVINGGLDEIEFDQNSPFHAGWGSVGRFLTYRPNLREVTEIESHHLYWNCWRLRGLVPGPDTPEAYRLKAKVYYTDGSNQTTTVESDPSVIKQLDTVRIRAGFKANFLDFLQPSKTPYKYDLWLEAQVGPTALSGIVTYHLQPSHHQERYISWRNSFGCAETTRFFGESKFLAEIEREFAQIPVPIPGEDYDLTANFSTVIAHSTKLNRSITIESGPMSAEELYAHTDMLKSDLVWLHLLPNNFMTPLLIPFKLKPGSFEMGYKNQEGFYINGVKLTIEFMDNRNWSNTLPIW